MLHHIINKLNASELHKDPWPHLVIDNILPDAEYIKLINVVKNTNSGIKPAGSAMENQTIIDTREATDNREFWDNWYSVFEHPEITAILRSKFGITQQFDLMRCDIHKCEPGFNLGEHNDVKGAMLEIVSLQIYLPLDTDAAQDGVVLHGTADKKIEYIPNRAWVFACGDDTFHSVPQCNRTRHSVLMKNVVMK